MSELDLDAIEARMEAVGRNAKVGKVITTPSELDALPPDAALVDNTGAPWVMYTQFDSEHSKTIHRTALILRLPMTVRHHPADRKALYRITEVEALRTDVPALIARVRELESMFSDLAKQMVRLQGDPS